MAWTKVSDDVDAARGHLSLPHQGKPEQSKDEAQRASQGPKPQMHRTTHPVAVRGPNPAPDSCASNHLRIDRGSGSGNSAPSHNTRAKTTSSRITVLLQGFDVFGSDGFMSRGLRWRSHRVTTSPCFGVRAPRTFAHLSPPWRPCVRTRRSGLAGPARAGMPSKT